MPIDREQLMEEIIPALYSVPLSSSDARVDGRVLAVAFGVFACGSAADQTQSQDNDEGRVFYHLAHSALELSCMLDNVSLLTVQALTLVAMYACLCGRKGGVEASWRWASLASNLATSVRLAL